MSEHRRIWSIALIAGLAIFALIALSATADPDDTTKQPTEDWIFDSGKPSTIISADWTMMYNITITNGSSLTIQSSKLVFDSSNPFSPNWILLEDGTLTISNSNLTADDEGPGFWIEVHNETDFNTVNFKGLARHPSTDAGISVYGTNATLSYVTILGTRAGVDALYGDNSNLTIDWSNFWNIGGAAITHHVGRNVFNETYTCKVWESEIKNARYGILVPTRANYGKVVVDCFRVNISMVNYGVIIEEREGGNGSVNAIFSNMMMEDIGEAGFWLQAVSEVAGSESWQNEFNVFFVESMLEGVNSTGFFVEMWQSPVDFILTIDNSKLNDIGNNAAFAFPGGICPRFYSHSGIGEFHIANTTFNKCSPSAFITADLTKGISDIHLFNCTITRSEGAAVLIIAEYSGSQPPLAIENSTIADNKGPAVDVGFDDYSSCSSVIVSNCTVVRNGGTVFRAVSSNYYAASGLGFNITNCLIKDNKGYVVELSSISTGGNSYVMLTDTVVENTLGLYIQTRDYWSDNPYQYIILTNTEMRNIGSDCIIVNGEAYQGGYHLFITLENTTLQNCNGNGIAVSVIEEYYYYTPVFDTVINIYNSSISGLTRQLMYLNIQTPENAGSRNFTMINTEVFGCSRGIYSIFHDGYILDCKFSDNLKEEIIASGCSIDCYYTTFDSITDSEFKVLEMGEINFYFDLSVFVRWDTGVAALGASVEIMDNTQTLISVQTVRNADGSVPTYTMNSYWVELTGVYSTSPYVITVSFMDIEKTEGVRLTKSTEVVILMEDHVSPEIVLLYPDDGHVQQSTILAIRGSAWDAQSGVKTVVLSLDGVNWEEAISSRGDWISWNQTINVSAELIQQFGGFFVLRAKAIDFADNEAEAIAIIRVDPTPPELKIDFPVSGYITNNPVLYVRGVTELGSTVRINGKSVEVTVSAFNHRVDLLEGPNSITIVSRDPLGNIQINTLTVTLDTQLPFIDVVTPKEDEVTNKADLLVTAVVEPNLEITINGYPVEPDGDTISYAMTLLPGDNPVIINAVDMAGNVRTIDRSVVLDQTKPWISLTTPQPGDRLSKREVTVKGTVEPGARLFIQDEAVNTDNGFFERVILAKDGENYGILLKAIDVAGNEYTETVEIYVDIMSPTLTITHPTELMTVGQRRFLLNGTIGHGADESLSTFKLLVNNMDYTVLYDELGRKVRTPIEFSLENGEFSIPVDLEEGRNDYTITVMDEVGNTAKMVRTVYLNSRAPTLVLYLDPVMRDEAGQFYTNALTLNVTGYTDPGSELRVRDILVTVHPDGTFNIFMDLVPEDTTVITVTSKNAAGNMREIQESVLQKKIQVTSEEEEGLGMGFFIAAIVIFIVVAIVAFMLVRNRREQYIEMQAAEATPLADLEAVDAELGITEGPAIAPAPAEEPRAAAPRPRPRPSQPRRPVRAEPKEVAEPDITEKDLTDQGAESDIGAHETEQEGN